MYQVYTIDLYIRRRILHYYFVAFSKIRHTARAQEEKVFPPYWQVIGTNQSNSSTENVVCCLGSCVVAMLLSYRHCGVWNYSREEPTEICMNFKLDLSLCFCLWACYDTVRVCARVYKKKTGHKTN